MRIIVAFALGLLTAAPAVAAPQVGWTLRFDLFSPQGIRCTAASPGGSVRDGRGLAGSPVVLIVGTPGEASAECSGPDGSRWRIVLPVDPRRPLATDVDVLVLFRQGSDRMVTLVTGDNARSPVVDRRVFARVP